MTDENEKEIVEDLVDGVAQEGRRWGCNITVNHTIVNGMLVILRKYNLIPIYLAQHRFGDRGSRGFGGGGARRGAGPGRKTNHRIIVENLSSRTSWQVRKGCVKNVYLGSNCPFLFD